MRYVSEKYERQLDELAALLLRPIGDAALQDTIEFDPIPLFPAKPYLRLVEPNEAA